MPLDFGRSLITDIPVRDLIVRNLPHTIYLTIVSVMMGLTLGIPLGVLAATRRNKPADDAVRIYSLIGYATPDFYLAAILLIAFSLKLGWFPISGEGDGFWDGLYHIILPAITLAMLKSAFPSWRRCRGPLRSSLSAMIAYPGGTPMVTGPSYMDPTGGFNAAAAVLTALHARDATGRGQHIEMAQVEAAMQFIGPELMAGTDVVPDGNHVPHMAPHNAYPCRGEDEWIAIAAPDDAAWQQLASLMDHGGLADDPRFAMLANRSGGGSDRRAGIWRSQ